MRVLRAARQISPPLPDDSEPLREAVRAYQLTIAGLHTRGLRRLRSAVESFAGDGPDRHRARALSFAGLAARAAGEWKLAAAELARASEAALAIKDTELASLCFALRVEGLCATGELDAAEAALKEWRLGRVGDAAKDDLANAILQLARGNLQEAAQLFGLARGQHPTPPGKDWAEVFLAEARADLGRHAEAEPELSALVERLEKDEAFDELFVRAAALLARVHAERAWWPNQTPPPDALERARRSCRRALAYSQNMPRYRATVLGAQAQLEGLGGGHAERALQEAIATCERAGTRLELGRLLARHAAFLNARAQQGTRPISARARDELTRCKADARSQALVQLESGGGGDAGASFMLSRSMLGKSVANVALGEEDVELAAVFAVNQAISSVLDVDQLLQRILNEVVKVLKAERGALLRVEQDGSTRCVAGRGLDPARVKEGSDEISFGIIEEVRKSGQVVLTDNAQVDQRFRGRASVLASDIRSLICAPMKTQKGLLGFLYVDSTLKSRIFKDAHKELLSIFATQAAIAIENATAFSQIDELNRGLEAKVSERTSELQTANRALEQSLEELKTTKLGLLEAQKQVLEKEMQVARSIQTSIVPKRELLKTRGVSLIGYLEPASEVGGDIWMYRELPDGRTLILVGDVTGHGVGSGMVTTAAKACCDTVVRATGGLDLTRFLTTMSDVINDSTQGALNMTAFACVVDPSQKTVSYANAAHNMPFFIRRAGGLPKMQILNAKGNRLGDGLSNPYEATTVPYESGDRLVLFTDGVIECTNPQGREYGQRRFVNKVLATARDPLSDQLAAVVAELTAYFADQPRADDVTLVIAELE